MTETHLPARPTTVGLVGFGRMGASIARTIGPDRVCVVEVDPSRRAAAVRAGFRATADLGALSSAGIVLEVVPEDPGAKRTVLGAVSRIVPEDAVIATGTSAISVSALAPAVHRRERFLAAHFFLPAPERIAIEVVRGAATTPSSIAAFRAFARSIGKRCVHVRDGYGFFTNRLLTPFLNEALLLVEGGLDVREVDGEFERFGFAAGPLRLLDHIGLGTAVRVGAVLEPLWRGLGPAATLHRRLLEHGCEGEESGSGLYRYGSGEPRPNPLVRRLVGRHRVRPGADDVLRRPLALFLSQAVRALGRGIVRSRQDGDLLAVEGLGFPRDRGGPFRFIAEVGAATVLGWMETLSRLEGQRFAPPELLVDWSRSGAMPVTAPALSP